MTQRGRTTGRPRAGRRAPDRPREDQSARRLRLRAVIEPVVTAAGYDLEDLSVSRAGRRYVVRVVVDGDGGVNLDAVADVSRLLSKALDQAEETGGDLVAGEYQLEVSSPGVDRPLTLPRHWRRNVGRLVKVTVHGPGQRPEPVAGGAGQLSTAGAGERPASGDRQLTARLVAADDERVVLETEAGPVGWAYPDLGPGRVQVEFSRLDEIGDDDADAGDDDLTDDDLTDAGDDDYDDVGNGDDEDVEGEER
ncbi:ribosome maturation factor RimP [Micromonospora sp. WMMD1102]|uniref:ribosome maturation factor RimP n=1 Tax=Micromonospora sp. WMMD1102 TaxID=3016105 RepID=UPI0024158FB4|nr:ribosome maturation factor RimP [Micromonospora sp. WMMD1102]MDG4785664.1 ribosome maturation factor RimP [Micromonospora sp. WMMD1102]